MEDQLQSVISSPQTAIRAKVCPCGNIYLYVGHTCVYLRQEEFLDLAQIVHATEDHLLEQQGSCPSERRH